MQLSLFRRAAVLALLALLPCAAALPFRVSNTLGASAVLQRDVPATVWGFGTPGAGVAATLDGAPAGRASVGADGVWRLALPPQPASAAPRALALAQDDGATAALDDLLFGDVYVCGGQSNAQFTLPQAFNAAEEVAAAAHYPNIRLFSAGQSVPPSQFAAPQVDISPVELPWSRASPATVGGGNWTHFSAVCWLFGRTLFDALGGAVPLGLLSVNWGGTDIQTWSSPDALAACAPNPNRNAPGVNANSSLWNSRMAPFTTGPTAMAGVHYYQGESNAPPFPIFKPGYYACALDALITDWRAKLRAGPALWFGVVQRAPLTAPGGSGYAEVREEQLAALRSANASVSTAADLGDALSPFGTYHPRFKRPVGERLAAAALRHRYGRLDGPAWLQPLATGGQDATPPGSGALALRVAFDPATVQGGALRLNASAAACPADDLAGTPPYRYYSSICAGFAVVVGAPAGAARGLPTLYSRLPGTALRNGVVLESGSYTLPGAQARCGALAAAGCVGFAASAGAPPPGDNATAALFTFHTLADLAPSPNGTAWATFTPYGTYALPAAAAVAADGVSVEVSAQCGALCASGQAVVRGVSYGWGSWPVMSLYAGSGMPALPFYVSLEGGGGGGAGVPVRHY